MKASMRVGRSVRRVWRVAVEEVVRQAVALPVGLAVAVAAGWWRR